MKLCLIGILCASLVGCSLPNAVGKDAGLWPKITVSEAPTFTQEEKNALADFESLYPDVTKKIIARNNELAAGVSAYNKRAREHNRAVYKLINMPDEQIDKLEP